jgi:hypothetical protein
MILFDGKIGVEAVALGMRMRNEGGKRFDDGTRWR